MPSRDASSIRNAKSLCELFQDTAAAHPDRLALEDSNGTVRITWSEYAGRVRQIAGGLHALGIRRGHTVGLLMSNRPEFHLIDAAVMHLGAIPFSIYHTSPANQVAYLFRNSGCRVVLCEEQYLDLVQEVAREAGLSHVVCIEGGTAATTSLAELEQNQPQEFDFETIWQAVQPEDVLTLIYTSGTTGAPKGVELTHANLMSNLAALLELTDADECDRVLSYLPDAHIVNRFVAQYAPAVWGMTVTTVADPKQLLEALPRVQPTIFVAVPMLWYKLKAALETRLSDAAGPLATLAAWAVSVSQHSADARINGRAPSLATRLQLALADRLILSRLRSRLGLDACRVAVTGAAPIAPEALAFVIGLGIPVCEAWGMSELAALATVNRPDDIRVGTVGKAAPGVDIRVADDGELLVRGPGVMKGYRNDPERTSEALDAEGWMHTGDIGSIDQEGFVRIVDRKKEMIINSGGKNMSPSNIENQLKVACPMIGSAVAIGDQRPFVVALITLDADAAATYAAEHGLDPDPASLATNAKVRALVDAGVAAANQRLARVEQVKYVEVLPTFWEPGGDELTPTMKLKRKPIAEKYASQIEHLYTSGAVR